MDKKRTIIACATSIALGLSMRIFHISFWVWLPIAIAACLMLAAWVKHRFG